MRARAPIKTRPRRCNRPGPIEHGDRRAADSRACRRTSTKRATPMRGQRGAERQRADADLPARLRRRPAAGRTDCRRRVLGVVARRVRRRDEADADADADDARAGEAEPERVAPPLDRRRGRRRRLAWRLDDDDLGMVGQVLRASAQRDLRRVRLHGRSGWSRGSAGTAPPRPCSRPRGASPGPPRTGTRGADRSRSPPRDRRRPPRSRASRSARARACTAPRPPAASAPRRRWPPSSVPGMRRRRGGRGRAGAGAAGASQAARARSPRHRHPSRAPPAASRTRARAATRRRWLVVLWTVERARYSSRLSGTASPSMFALVDARTSVPSRCLGANNHRLPQSDAASWPRPSDPTSRAARGGAGNWRFRSSSGWARAAAGSLSPGAREERSRRRAIASDAAALRRRFRRGAAPSCRRPRRRWLDSFQVDRPRMRRLMAHA